MFSITLSSSTAQPLALPPGAWQVQQLTWRAVGGPWRARLRVDMPHTNPLWRLADLLGCAVTVSDGRGPAWWGYLASAELRIAGRAVRYSLDGMANQVAVSYHEPAPEGLTGPRRLSEWQIDAASTARYGIKQEIFDLGLSGNAPATPAEAARYAANDLRQTAWPEAYPVASPEKPVDAHHAPLLDEAPYAILEARGWWEMLDWQYYADPRGQEGHLGGGSVAVGVGDRPAAARLAQSFSLATADGWSADAVWLKLRRNGAADDLRLELCAGSPTAPGAALAYATLPAVALSEELAWTRFDLLPQPPLTNLPELQPGATYWLALSRAGALDAARCVQVAANESIPYPRGALHQWDGATWLPRAPQASLHFQVLGSQETAAQIGHLLEATGIFSRARVECASGINARIYRDGSRSAREEVSDLLRAGTATQSRLLASVTPGRVARVYAAPPPAQCALALGSGGQVRRLDGRALSPSEWPAGRWAWMGALGIPTYENEAGPHPPNRFFIEACAWDFAAGTFTLTQPF